MACDSSVSLPVQQVSHLRKGAWVRIPLLSTFFVLHSHRCILVQVRLNSQTIHDLYALVKGNPLPGFELCSDPAHADVIVTAIRMKARLERHVDLDSTVSPQVHSSHHVFTVRAEAQANRYAGLAQRFRQEGPPSQLRSVFRSRAAARRQQPLSLPFAHRVSTCNVRKDQDKLYVSLCVLQGLSSDLPKSSACRRTPHSAAFQGTPRESRQFPQLYTHHLCRSLDENMICNVRQSSGRAGHSILSYSDTFLSAYP
jgi:hypothetical protein